MAFALTPPRRTPVATNTNPCAKAPSVYEEYAYRINYDTLVKYFTPTQVKTLFSDTFLYYTKTIPCEHLALYHSFSTLYREAFHPTNNEIPFSDLAARVIAYILTEHPFYSEADPSWEHSKNAIEGLKNGLLCLELNPTTQNYDIKVKQGE